MQWAATGMNANLNEGARRRRVGSQAVGVDHSE